MVRKESPERAQRAKDDVFHEVAGRAETHCTGSWKSTRPIHNSQEQLDEADESSRRSEEAQGARECGQRRLSRGGPGELGHHHEEEITQFDVRL